MIPPLKSRSDISLMLQALDALYSITDRVNRVQVEQRADSLGEDTSTDIRLGLVEVAYEWARGMVSKLCSLPSTRLDVVDPSPGTALQSDHRPHGCAGGYNRQSYYSPGRNLPRSERCSAGHWRHGSLQQDGAVSSSTQGALASTPLFFLEYRLMLTSLCAQRDIIFAASLYL